MIAYVKGIIEDKAEDCVVLEVGGFGVNIYISADTAAKLPQEGEEIKLYTYTLVKEDAFKLYGFLTRDDLDIFKKCITVNGIGPKGALAILSVMDADTLRYAILSGDTKTISRAPGIGARTAERLILDLKDKIKIEDTLIGKEIVQTASGNSTADSPQKKEAVEALVSLGYSQTESIRAVNSIENIESLDAGAVLKQALKKMF